MSAVTKSARVCKTCGSRIDTTSAGDLGCIACLIGAGLDAEAERSDPAFVSASDQLGAYTIEHHADGSAWELGRGAMGVTYRAIDKALDRPVALKIISTNPGTHSAEARERFTREARAAAALRHPNVATVYQFGVREETGQFFYAMELVEGETLEERVRRLGPLDVLTTIDIALQVTAALEAAEERGLVHRDLKPGNLMLVSQDNALVGMDRRAVRRAHRQSGSDRARPTNSYVTVKVIDFGVAKAVAEKTNTMALTHGGFVGTPAFASPEQFTNAPVDVRSDIYSLGVTLWFLLTGHMLFSGRTIEEIRDDRRSEALPIEQLKAAQVPRRFISLLTSMLAIEPAARPAGAGDLSATLRGIRASILGGGKTAGRIALAAAIVALATIVAVQKFHSSKATGSAVPEKSIAVLPFENLSADPDNTYFADGIQEEILTRLAGIADLKVISRASTQRYHSKPNDLSKIAKQLRVATILQGSVQKTADHVRVNVQLINAETDSHVWADSYDRKLNDILGVESEIAKRIAESLKAKLTGQEKQVIAAKPTDNPEAYDAYLRGLAYTLRPMTNSAANALAAQRYLKEAVRLDPKFALAWAILSTVDARGYRLMDLQPTTALREEARQAAETALTLQPNLGEAVLAEGYYYYYCLQDYDTAVHYFDQAHLLLPNSSEVAGSLAYVARRRGQWERSEQYFDEAERLDPRNVTVLLQHAGLYVALRRFSEATRKLDQVLSIMPDDVDTIANKAAIAQAEGDLTRASMLLAPLHPNADDTDTLETQVYQAILERHPAPMIKRLQEVLAKPDPALGFLNGELRFWLGWAQEVAGDGVAAQESWRQARSDLESFLKEQPENFQLIAYLALTNMGLGDKNASFALVDRAMAAAPIKKNALDGTIPIEILARVAARMGEPDRSIAALQKLLSVPGNLLLGLNIPFTPALLRLDPMFDSLRNDPRFQELCKDKIDKSIAVLPFENLSANPDNAYFADGIQEEILTRLAQLAELKVISRSSTQRYQSKPRDLGEIAKQLGVANILEGSVQKTADQVRVNVQLINAQTDSHLWAETYDRKLTDIFGVESEIAKRIAESLQAKITGREEQALATKPTKNPEAYDAYLRGLAFEARDRLSASPGLSLEPIGLYERAVQLDPNFALAWARLSRADAFLYFHRAGADTTRRDAAKRALENAQNLDPNSPETLLAFGYYQYWGLYDYGAAKATFERARKMLPNSSEVPRALGLIARREGHWDEGIAYWEQALALDPRNVELLTGAAGTYGMLRQFPAALKLYDRVLDIMPNNRDVMSAKAGIYQAQGDLQQAAGLLSDVNWQTPDENTLGIKIGQLRLERNYGEAIRMLQTRLTQFHFDSRLIRKATRPAAH